MISCENKYKNYKKLRCGLEFMEFIFAFVIADITMNLTGIYNKNIVKEK